MAGSGVQQLGQSDLARPGSGGRSYPKILCGVPQGVIQRNSKPSRASAAPGKMVVSRPRTMHLLPLFGAIPVNARVVGDEKFVFAAGVTAGIDGALRVAADLRGAEVAQAIQLSIAYAPEPPFNSGTPQSAPPAVLERVQRSYRAVTEQREQTARRVAERLGIAAAR
jgi:cyclohexyl-isocyanide hydratase